MFKRKHYKSEIITLCVRWFLKYPLSYRNLRDMMEKRGLNINHMTIYRWVFEYSSKLNLGLRKHLKPTGDSWRMDETYLNSMAMENDTVNIAIVFDTSVPSNRSIRHQNLFTSHDYLLVSKDSRLTHKHGIGREDLKDETLVLQQFPAISTAQNSARRLRYAQSSVSRRAISSIAAITNPAFWPLNMTTALWS